MKIEIETNDCSIAENLLETTKIVTDSEILIPGNAKLRYLGKISKKGILPGINNILEFTITFASGVISSLVASWLYSKLKDCNIKTIRFERKQIAISKEGIQKVIEEFIQIK
jgi:hypothetical protein